MLIAYKKTLFIFDRLNRLSFGSGRSHFEFRSSSMLANEHS